MNVRVFNVMMSSFIFVSSVLFIFLRREPDLLPLVFMLTAAYALMSQLDLLKVERKVRG